MSVGWTQVLLAFLWGGFVSVERKAFLQAMISRPLASATVMGLLLGDLRSGLFIGMLLELFYLGTANLGASLPENDTVSATGTAAAAATMAAAHGSGLHAGALVAGHPALFGAGPGGARRGPHAGGLHGPAGAGGHGVGRGGQPLARGAAEPLGHVAPLRRVRAGGGGVRAARLLHRAAGGEAAAADLLRGLAWAFPAMASVAAALAAQGSHAKRAPLYSGLGATVVTLAVILLTFKECR